MTRRTMLHGGVVTVAVLLLPASHAVGQSDDSILRSTARAFFGPAGKPVRQPTQDAGSTPSVSTRPEASHQQVAKISVGATPNAICVTADDKLLVAVAGSGTNAGRIQVYDRDGRKRTSWDLDLPAESLNVAPNGRLFVAGGGRIARLDTRGRVLATADLPHVGNLAELRQQMRELAVQQIALAKQRRQVLADQYEARVNAANVQVEEARERLDELRKSEDANAEADSDAGVQYRAKEAVLKGRIGKQELNARQLRQRFEAMTRAYREPDLELQVAAALKRKLKTSALAVSDEYVFVAVAATKGFGYAVWRMDHEFSQPQEIVTGLRGCCGQMDIQCCRNEVLVAENSRHRVSRYAADGSLIGHFGARDRTGKAGFSGCCNPMNLRIDAAGAVYTAESTTGLIKKYSLAGEQQSLIGKAQVLGGCKNVAVAATSDGSRVYMLDVTRRSICVLQPTETTGAAAE